MLDELRTAIAAADWPRALGLALDAWRTTRWPALADLIDRIATQCPTEPAPRHRVQPWWMQRAQSYDPIGATALVASASALAHKSDVTWDVIAGAYPELARPLAEAFELAITKALPARRPEEATPFRGLPFRNLVERFAALCRWPPDPRVTRVIAGWLRDAKIAWTFPYDSAGLALYELLADELVRLGDARAIRDLEACIAEPRGKTISIREHQRALASRTIDALAARILEAPPLDAALAAEIARWCPIAAEPAPELDERVLWRDAAAAPADDLGPRLVLADYLLQRGDRRGEIITLACAGTEDNRRRSSNLLHAHWEHWMGELALVLDRGHCTFTGGLLDIATVGMFSTPEWAYPKVARHRELASVRTVRPGWNASENGYVAFLHALEALPPRVRVTATMFEPLARLRATWPVRVLELVTNLYDLQQPLADVIALAGPLLPAVEEIEVPLPSEIDATLIALVPRLRDYFPKLARVRIDATRRLPADLTEALAGLRTLPFVEINR